MKFKSLQRWVYGALLAWLTAEILVRRWVWHQVPTQVPTGVVYATVAVNVGVLMWMVWRARAGQARAA